MANLSEQFDQYLKRWAALRKSQSEVTGRNRIALGLLIDEVSHWMIRLAGSLTNVEGAAIQDEAQRRAIMREIDGLLGEAEGRATSIYRVAYAEMQAVLLNEMVGAFGVFGRSTQSALEAAIDVFDETKASALFNDGFSDWITDFNRIGGDLRASMWQGLGQARLRGWDRRQLARYFIESGGGRVFAFENLPPIGERGEAIFTMGGTLGQDGAVVRRAHTIARTKLTAARNLNIIEWATLAGFSLFTNRNEQPVAVECIEANEQPPMPIESVLTESGEISLLGWLDWRASNQKGGVPPRHPNCDSDLQPYAPFLNTSPDPAQIRDAQQAYRDSVRAALPELRALARGE